MYIYICIYKYTYLHCIIVPKHIFKFIHTYRTNTAIYLHYILFITIYKYIHKHLSHYHKCDMIKCCYSSELAFQKENVFVLQFVLVSLCKNREDFQTPLPCPSEKLIFCKLHFSTKSLRLLCAKMSIVQNRLQLRNTNQGRGLQCSRLWHSPFWSYLN